MTVIVSDRLRLRNWRENDREAFANLNSDPEVMWDFGGPLNRAESDTKFDSYVAAFEQYGYCRWVIESLQGDFLGYTGIMPSKPDHPLGFYHDMGWRLLRTAWGRGYATEAARAALHDGFERVGLREVLAITAPANIRSQAVMARLNLARTPSLDYSEPRGTGLWHGLVWVARSGGHP
jgi:RimJ/RimL family protein N-acetyltransferase